MMDRDLPFYIFAAIVTLVTLIVACAIAHLLWTHFKERLVEWRRIRKFAAELPENERAGFWRVYRQRRNVPRDSYPIPRILRVSPITALWLTLIIMAVSGGTPT
jgi:hypothetical protein